MLRRSDVREKFYNKRPIYIALLGHPEKDKRYKKVVPEKSYFQETKVTI